MCWLSDGSFFSRPPPLKADQFLWCSREKRERESERNFNEKNVRSSVAHTADWHSAPLQCSWVKKANNVIQHTFSLVSIQFHQKQYTTGIIGHLLLRRATTLTILCIIVWFVCCPRTHIRIYLSDNENRSKMGEKIFVSALEQFLYWKTLPATL